MKFRTKLDIALLIALVPITGTNGHAAPPAPDPKTAVLERLNAAAANFHSAAADVEFHDITTDPVYDEDVFKGVVYYDRKGKTLSMGAHFNQHNGKPSSKAYTYVGGVLNVRESQSDSVKTYANAAKWESYIMLGFGASGTDLAAKWDIKYLGSESLSDGKNTIKTEILELVAKDPEVRKNIAKVKIWVDPDRAVSLKQDFTLNASSSKTCVYSNFKVNQFLPSDAFTLKSTK
jgi:outer membrane lipoprotein-sorting protein